jgi:hypothetical protein
LGLEPTVVQSPPVSKLVRILAVMLITLIVPVQGIAAVISAQCSALDGHEHALDASSHDAHPHPDGAAEHGEEQSHCGPCTACCGSASITAAPAKALPALPSAAQYLFSQSAAPDVAPGRVYRPPLAL